MQSSFLLQAYFNCSENMYKITIDTLIEQTVKGTNVYGILSQYAAAIQPPHKYCWVGTQLNS
jgi:hypothetical protein